MFDKDKIPWYEAFAFGRAPYSAELRIVNVLNTQCMMEYKWFYDAMKKGKRIAKYKIFTLFFDNNKLSVKDRVALKNLSRINANKLGEYDDVDVTVLTIYFERGFAMHTLGAIFTFKYLVCGSYDGKLGLLDKIYKKAGIYVELSFDTIDYNPFYSIINRTVHIITKEIRNIRVSTYQTDSMIIIRSCSSKRWKKYRYKHLPCSLPNCSRYTLEEIMAFKDWHPNRYIKCGPRLTKYYGW